MSQNVSPARKVRVTAQRVALMALTETVAAVAKLHNTPGSEIAPATFDAALELLAGQPAAREALEALRPELFGDSTPGERGRPAARVGDTRGYKVQQVGEDGDAFIRLPVALLGSRKGDTVSVQFLDGVIKVTA